jgi:RNase H-fold protein (predicted Holliday junction resolvase)
MILAIDPGREKCGLACLAPSGTVQWHRIVPSPELVTALVALPAEPVLSAVVIGSGTTSAQVATLCRNTLGPEARIEIVEERNSTLEARTLYFVENPPRGLWRLVPRGLLTPPVPVDDYAAIILGQRFLAQATGPTGGNA